MDADVETPEIIALKIAAARLNQINILWERTQALLAISLTASAIYLSVRGTLADSETLKNALFVVIGFYFGRTNHARPVLDVVGGK